MAEHIFMETTASPDSKFEAEIDLIQRTIEDFEQGRRSNVAIISEPFYGETALFKAVEKMAYQSTKRISARSLIRDVGILEETPASIVIVEGLHHLYRRKIGGFDPIRRFLRHIASSDRLIIATCNAYSWRYLDEVLDLGEQFSVQATLPRWDFGEIREMLLEGYEEGELRFEGPEVSEPERSGPIRLERRSMEIKPLDRMIELPFPAVDLGAFRSKEVGRSAEDLFFERLNRMADGNPGVAKFLWKGALDYPEVRNVLEEPSGFELDRNESFVLSIILSAGPIEKNELSETVGPVDEQLYVLSDRRLISVEGDVCSIRPEALRSVVDYLKRVRLVW